MVREPILVAESVATDEEQVRLGLLPGEIVYRLDRIRGHREQLLVENIGLAAAPFPRPQHPASVFWPQNTACNLAKGWKVSPPSPPPRAWEENSA